MEFSSQAMQTSKTFNEEMNNTKESEKNVFFRNIFEK